MRVFKVPQTLAADFDSFLSNNIENQVMNFQVIKNWYDPQPYVIRGELYPDSTKSRYENTDNNMNLRASLASGITKGDIVIDENDEIYILDWYITKESNNYSTRALRCNTKVEFLRYTEETVDENGMLVSPEGLNVIAELIPCNMYRYDGRPEYSAAQGTPGIAPNALTLATVQYNDQTKRISEGDKFVWGNDMYTIVDVNYVGLDIDLRFGTIKLQAKKDAGGVIVD